MKNDKVNSNSIASLIFAFTKASFLGSGFIFVFSEISKSHFLGMIIGLVLSFLFAFIFFKVLDIYPEKNLYEKLEVIFPKWISTIILLILIIIIFIVGSFLFFRLISFLSTHYLTKASNIVLALLLNTIILYLSINNFEVVTRFASISFVICAAIYIFNITSLLQYFDINNIKPFLVTDATSVVKTSLVTAFLFSGPLFLLTFFRKNDIKNNNVLKKKVFLFYGLSAIVLFSIAIMITGCLGIELVSIFTYPEYIVLKKINILNFISSVENISVLLWFFYIIITTSFGLIVIKKIISKKLKIKKNKNEKIIVLIMIIISIVIQTILFNNDYSLDTPELVYIPALIYALFIFISLIILITYKLKKHKV